LIDFHIKVLNKGKSVIIDFQNDDWIENPNLFEIESYVIEKMSNYSSSYYSSSNQSRFEESFEGEYKFDIDETGKNNLKSESQKDIQ